MTSNYQIKTPGSVSISFETIPDLELDPVPIARRSARTPSPDYSLPPAAVSKTPEDENDLIRELAKATYYSISFMAFIILVFLLSQAQLGWEVSNITTIDPAFRYLPQCNYFRFCTDNNSVDAVIFCCLLMSLLSIGIIILFFRRRSSGLLLVYLVLALTLVFALGAYGYCVEQKTQERVITILNSWEMLPNRTRAIVHYLGSCCGLHDSSNIETAYCPSKIGCIHRIDLISMSVRYYLHKFFMFISTIGICMMVLLSILCFIQN